MTDADDNYDWRKLDIVERLRSGQMHWARVTISGVHHDDAPERAADEIVRLRAELDIERTPHCFSCGAKVTEICPRGAATPCGREHEGGSRLAMPIRETEKAPTP